MHYKSAIVEVVKGAAVYQELRTHQQLHPVHGIALVAVRAVTPPAWMKAAHRAIQCRKPQTFLEAQLVASLAKLKAEKQEETH